MLGITFTSENFEKLLFKLQTQQSSPKLIIPTVLASSKPSFTKKNNIVIISNGVQQNLSKPKRKRYVFSDDEIQSKSSENGSFSFQKKHIIKKQKKEDPDYSVKRQKNDRNVVSNIIHHLMKHVLTMISHQQIIRVLNKKQINLSLSNFLQVLEQKQKQCKTYITNKHLKQLWNDPDRIQFSKAMRIISRIFLQNYSFLTIFNGNKLNRESKAIHYKGRRELIQFLSKLK